MKFLKLLAVILVPLLAMSLFQSCSKDNVVDTTDESAASMSYNLYDYNFSVFSMKDASIDSDFKLDDCQPLNPISDIRDEKRPPHAGNKNPLQRVFAAMNLTEEQKAEIRSLMNAHIICEMQWFRKLQTARKEVMDAARAERQDILAKVRSGEITRQDAQELLKELNKATREALQNLPINEEVREGIKLCREELFEAIRLLLTEDQLVIWEKFLDTLPRK